MKLFSILCSLLAFSNLALAGEGCPNFQGEFVANACSKANSPFTTLAIHQPDCRTIGFQTLTHLSDGKISYGQVNWEPIGSGKLLEREDSQNAYYREKFYDQDSLYSFSYKVDKASNSSTTTRAEVIDTLRDGNIFVSYGNYGSGNIWFNVKNCK